ncbi:hypothetical protein [Actinomarinicola tropica]|uniref:Uncharacterized protein n=1 Tax=Actinomarinicola tropica TaxID=2789776 RepID=A0A5Q2RK95_9ACTN|nr:hypothetical protein [Actinomarinicola tropica]QGG94477.1 hypothetical protein GH723_04810 [Actinomarinicola tropica]
MSDPQRPTHDRDLPESMEEDELTRRPGEDQMPSDPDVQAERPLDDIGDTDG